MYVLGFIGFIVLIIFITFKLGDSAKSDMKCKSDINKMVKENGKVLQELIEEENKKYDNNKSTGK